MRITFAPWGETLAEMADAAARAEAAGAEAVWAPELHRSATVTAAALVQATSTAQVGTAITLAFTRSPMVTALEALDLDELSDGRFVLGLGTGVQRLNEDWHNARWGKPVTHIRETVRNVRHFVANATSGEPMELDGEHEPMRIRGYERPYPVRRTEIPVYLAAMGPAMTRLAGRIADGWISHELCSPSYLKDRILPEIDAGIDAVEGRERSDIELVVSACCSVAADPAAAVDRVRGHVGFYASVRTYADFFGFHGLGEAQQRVIDAFRAGAGAEHLAAAVTPDMVDAVTLNGDRDRVATQLAAYEGIADAVKLSAPTHGLTPAEIRAGQDEVIGLIASLTGGRP
ncbi:LLM class flavin-dependent oxidoreductase [Nocardioides sp. zg-536]|uniref:LLM class flavin-dependent oxidoreductase n=1 Tax=Nocardioides faecalis TaxID=2803858 RepID=A0A938XZN4_9ACTN|nr:LLM class flavin-dependent oxidoreductase [Nocardioides faecalis]MBM9459166.1 LLM class flavin-dependent oxidoreductase [Nocardioides faecalis]MBS4751414.1 LLM class flavin-dependent oxidoreductase [Nocardioides faecalis]QVI59692.1 LLM class flavin-dependent oxidoreductase [Nocardioides faecalis]